MFLLIERLYFGPVLVNQFLAKAEIARTQFVIALCSFAFFKRWIMLNADIVPELLCASAVVRLAIFISASYLGPDLASQRLFSFCMPVFQS